jgi:beta-galactosidase
MGNSNGSLADYWDVIDRTPGLQGGFIWEWKDHGLLATLPNGKRGFAYGGQFGDDPNDGNFVADGLMSSDLRAHPAMQEVAWVYRPVTVERSDDAASLTVTNRRSFTDLEDLRADWELLVDGVVADAGELDVGLVAAGSAVTVEVPCGSPGGDAHLTVRWSQRRATPWAPAGHLVAWDQLPLTPSMAPSIPSATPVPPEIARNPVARRNTDAIFRMDGGGGRRVGGTSARRAAADGAPWGDVELCLFRAPVDNDGLKLLPDLGRRVGAGAETLARWREIGVDRLPADELVAHEHRVERDADGAEVHHHEVRVPDDLADLPRIGIRFELPAAFDRMRWYGRGPLENYPDRNRGALLGIWAAGIDEPPYLVPQDFGLRTDCRWFELVGDDGTTVRLEPLDPPVLHCAATHFRVEDLAGAAHETELRPRRRLIVHADVAHRGLGTASCGPDVLDRYRIAPGTYRFTYRLSTAVRTDAGASARSPGR